MAQCNFCGSEFTNTQGVRAHLRHCRVYRLRRQSSSAAGTGSLPRRTLPVGRVMPEANARQIATRPAPARHMEATPESPPSADSRPAYVPSAISEARERARRQEAEEAVRSKRREIIQRIKQRVVGNWLSIGFTISPEVKARALSDIEREFAIRPVEDLPEWELTALAEGIRDKHYAPVIAAHEAARRDAERRRDEERRREQTQARAAELVEYAVDWARDALRDVRDLSLADRLRILRDVEGELADVLTGTESERMVERRVDDILDDELGEDSTDDDLDD